VGDFLCMGSVTGVDLSLWLGYTAGGLRDEIPPGSTVKSPGRGSGDKVQILGDISPCPIAIDAHGPSGQHFRQFFDTAGWVTKRASGL